MAGAGTGLPTQRGQVATTLVDQQAYGAGEMAAAEGMARAAQGIDRLIQKLEPALEQDATKRGQQDAAAGQFRERIVLTGADAAYNEALMRGTNARLDNDADAFIQQAQIDNAFDPEGFKASTAAYRQAALDNGVPGALAIDWGLRFDRRRNDALGTVQAARANRDLTEAQGALTARRTTLVNDIITAGAGRPLGMVLADPSIAASMDELRATHETLAGNPAFGISPEESAVALASDVARIKAGAVSGHIVETLRTQGTDAAYAELQEVQTVGVAGMTREEQDLAVATAREALNSEIGLANQRTAQANAERSQAEQAINRAIDEDVAAIQLNGSGAGLTEDQVRAVRGNDGVIEWYRRRAEAQEFHRKVGDLEGLSPEEAAARIAQGLATRPLGAMGPVSNEGDLNALVAAITQVESGGRDGLVSADPDGAGPAGGGAYGRMQIIPETAQRIAQQLGLPYDQNRLRNDAAYNEQIGRAYLTELLNHYDGDSFLAVTAYHAGQGNVDGWLRSVGDPRSGAISREAWLDGVEARGNPRSAAYPRKVMAALGAGEAAAVWDGYQQQRGRRAADPAGVVQTDFAVRAARERWQAAPTSVPAGEAFVQANMDAQERARIPQGQRRSLPTATLVVYAGDLERFADAQDTAGFNGYAQSIVRAFGSQGERVLQDVLEVRGDTRFAAQVAARATGAATRGERPGRQQVEQANTANRTTQMNRAANGTTNVRQMTDAEVLAAAGL